MSLCFGTRTGLASFDAQRWWAVETVTIENQSAVITILKPIIEISVVGFFV